MGISRTENQITWGASVTKSVAASGTATSDSQGISSNAINGALYLKAENLGTPVDGDQVQFKVLFTGGDPDTDPDTSDEYETGNVASTVAIIDTYNDDNPGLIMVPINTAAKGLKVYASNDSDGNSHTVSAQYVEQTAT